MTCSIFPIIEVINQKGNGVLCQEAVQEISPLDRQLYKLMLKPLQTPNNIIPSKQNFVCYDFETSSSGEFQVEVFLSPSLNWNNSGLIYGYQIDDGAEVEINFNGKYKGELGNWQADRIIRSLSVAKLEQGKHRLLFYAKSPDVILQKIVLHFGEIKETYLGRNRSCYEVVLS